MLTTRRVTFKLYPTKKQEVKLHYWRKLHQYLYNACLSHRITEYRHFGKSISYFDQQNCLPEFKKCWPEYKELGSQALQATCKRVDYALSRFFQGLAKFPKFKNYHRYRGWTYPGRSGWKAHTTGDHGALELSNLGQIRMRGKARTWGQPTTCTILWKNNQWYCSITVKCEVFRESRTGAIGVDFGVFQAIALSDSTIVENPKFLAKTQDKIKKASRQLRRKCSPDRKKRIKASGRWKKARRKVSKLQNKVANQRQDWQHKVTSEIVSGNSLVATEKLNLKGMTRKAKTGSKRSYQKTGLNRNLLDVGIGNLTQLIKYKVEESGGVFVEVPLKIAPSQTCPNCGKKRKKDLSERVHHCDCGIDPIDRDVASAMVMLNYARGLGTSLLNRGFQTSGQVPTDKNCGGFAKVWEMKRQKPRMKRSGIRR
ncbi:MAG: transposase [Crocosphaera sp.]|nr:transposase [Crocosphaera sp.]